MPFIDPVSTKSCSHTFCLECINTAISVSPQCPVDRSYLTEKDLRPANPILRNLVDELLVECSNRSAGCNISCQRQLLDSHINADCQFVLVKCRDSACGRLVFKQDAGKHSEQCANAVVSCPDCGLEVTSKALDSHQRRCAFDVVECSSCHTSTCRGDLAAHTMECDYVEVDCVHSAYGCSWTGKRNEYTRVHLLGCPYEALKGFMALNAAKMSSLATENSALRFKVEQLEGSLRTVQHGLRTAKEALGPWSEHVQSEESSNPRLSTSHPPSLTGNSAFTSTDSIATTSFMNFAAEEFRPPVSDPFQLRPLDPVYQRPPPISIPPVDVTGTLEGALGSLRNSIVALSNSLDSTTRRHDIALITETSRLLEEVQSLRAIVHGVRMQVHQIMMERARRPGDDGWSPVDYTGLRPPGSLVTSQMRRTTENKL